MNHTKPFARWTAPIAVAIVFTSTSALAFEPGSTECIAPSGAGGGWDMTCRLVGKTLQDLKLIPGTMQVINKAGGSAPAKARVERVAQSVADVVDRQHRE